jgi:peptide/nickel transport system ATP-binding protein
MTEPLLSVSDLRVSFDTPDGVVHAVDGVSFTLEQGKTLGIVGESGSGKSVTSSTIMGLTKTANATVSGSIVLGGHDILQASDAEIRSLRGREMAMVFQDPMSALNPYYTVGQQIGEAYRVHHPKASKKEMAEVATTMMDKVGIPNPSARARDYPHQFSGGMRQRVVIAIALTNNPRLLIADEPTSALDVTVQAQILELMKSLQEEFGSAIILISHDLGVIAELADEVGVMYAGRMVERATATDLFQSPTHPYTWGLMGAVQSLGLSARGQLQTIPGSPPSLINLPKGCAFRPRCAYSDRVGERCNSERPELREVVPAGTLSACHLPVDVMLEIGVKRESA